MYMYVKSAQGVMSFFKVILDQFTCVYTSNKSNMMFILIEIYWLHIWCRMINVAARFLELPYSSVGKVHFNYTNLMNVKST